MSFVSEPELGFVRVDNAEEIRPRDYQFESIEALRTNIRKGIRAQVLCSPTGSGKTEIGAYLLRECWQKGKRGIFAVDRTVLVKQTSERFDRYGIPHGIVQAGNPRYRPGELIQICSLQTVQKRGWPQADLIMVDECHSQMRVALEHIASTKAVVIGLTATPFARGMAKTYGAVVNVTTTDKLTKDGFLVPFKVWAAKEPDMKGAKVTAGEWSDNVARERSMPIVGDVVSEYLKHGEGKKLICFGVDVIHCEAIQRQFLMSGIDVRLHTYVTPDEERDLNMWEFRKPDSCIRGLISVSALSRGLDVPDVAVIIMARPYKTSLAEVIQVVGRGLRPHHCKPDGCVILDLAGNFMRHWPAMAEFFADGCHELDDGKKKEKQESKPLDEDKTPRKCPKCSHVILGRADFCGHCGFMFPPRRSIQHEMGELAQFEGEKKPKLDRSKKVSLHAQLVYICKMKGYNPGWIFHAYKQIAGVEPQGMSRTAMELPQPWLLTTIERMNRARRKARQKPSMEVDLFA